MSIKGSLVAILALILFAGCEKEKVVVKEFGEETVELRTISSYESSLGRGHTIVTATKPSGFKTEYRDSEDNDLILDEVRVTDENNNTDFYRKRDNDLSRFQADFERYMRKFKENE